MKYEYKKLDKRNTGYGVYTYSVNIPYSGNAFPSIRLWLTETYGASVEIDIGLAYPSYRNTKWAWERNTGKDMSICRIFIKSDEELTLFLMKWS